MLPGSIADQDGFAEEGKMKLAGHLACAIAVYAANVLAPQTIAAQNAAQSVASNTKPSPVAAPRRATQITLLARAGAADRR